MSKPIDRAQIEHLAQLASLSLTADEVDAMTHEIGAILGYVAELESVDTRDVPPTAHVQLARAAWREDAVEAGLSHDDALAQAPRKAPDGSGFAVPAFVESE
jgi:aspartyl-tRNA(Asn)/glutamyl-tRNA(Gln) amidotransferase subunit C